MISHYLPIAALCATIFHVYHNNANDNLMQGVLMKRFGNCSNCARGISIKVNNDIFCSIHGAVSKDYRCSKYVRKPAVWSVEAPAPAPENEKVVKCIECEFFLVPASNRETSPDIGYCQLFTVRHYNGRTKNACSKFTGKAAHNIS